MARSPVGDDLARVESSHPENPTKGQPVLHATTPRERVDHDLLHRYRDHGDLQSRERLTERMTPLVRSIARRYQGRGQDMEDLVQAGLVGLTKAIERFDLDSGNRLVTYAVPNIQGEIRRHFRDRTWAVHVPRAVQELDARVQSLRRDILQETGCEATVDELADHLDTSEEAIEDAHRAGRAYTALSLDQPSGEGRTLGDGRGCTDAGYADVENRSVTDDALDALDERARHVIDLRFQRGLLQREIAEQIGVSQMQVSRILSQACSRMQEHLEARGRNRTVV
jgi:RNA polymerase sigma-B factor